MSSNYFRRQIKLGPVPDKDFMPSAVFATKAFSDAQSYLQTFDQDAKDYQGQTLG